MRSLGAILNLSERSTTQRQSVNSISSMSRACRPQTMLKLTLLGICLSRDIPHHEASQGDGFRPLVKISA